MQYIEEGIAVFEYLKLNLPLNVYLAQHDVVIKHLFHHSLRRNHNTSSGSDSNPKRSQAVNDEPSFLKSMNNSHLSKRDGDDEEAKDNEERHNQIKLQWYPFHSHR
ncbi:unnamed protein product [Allacma fusca]|uniref:Uncharacterized protein n=1 Tax=Allacma fusca TaxID=39272 RepID=A0A8J2J8K6_9HEXA|nr:unnamed protein product [Allacma fusca]